MKKSSIEVLKKGISKGSIFILVMVLIMMNSSIIVAAQVQSGTMETDVATQTYSTLYVDGSQDFTFVVDSKGKIISVVKTTDSSTKYPQLIGVEIQEGLKSIFLELNVANALPILIGLDSDGQAYEFLLNDIGVALMGSPVYLQRLNAQQTDNIKRVGNSLLMQYYREEVEKLTGLKNLSKEQFEVFLVSEKFMTLLAAISDSIEYKKINQQIFEQLVLESNKNNQDDDDDDDDDDEDDDK